jgi:hypothetical protein
VGGARVSGGPADEERPRTAPVAGRQGAAGARKTDADGEARQGVEGGDPRAGARAPAAGRRTRKAPETAAEQGAAGEPAGETHASREKQE